MYLYIAPFQYNIFNILRYEFVYRKSTFLCKIKNGVFVRLDRFGCINYECKRRVKYLWSLWRLCTLLTFTRNTSIKAQKYEIGSNHRNYIVKVSFKSDINSSNNQTYLPFSPGQSPSAWQLQPSGRQGSPGKSFESASASEIQISCITHNWPTKRKFSFNQYKINFIIREILFGDGFCYEIQTLCIWNSLGKIDDILLYSLGLCYSYQT